MGACSRRPSLSECDNWSTSALPSTSRPRDPLIARRGVCSSFTSCPRQGSFVARSPQPRHRARHVSGSQWAVLDDLARVVRAASPRPSALAAKTTAVVAAGSLAFAVMLPGEEASASVSQRAVVDDSIPVGTAAMALLSDRGDEAASRAMARVPVALAAPAVTGAKAAPVFGKLSVTAVEKPRLRRWLLPPARPRRARPVALHREVARAPVARRRRPAARAAAMTGLRPTRARAPVVSPRTR